MSRLVVKEVVSKYNRVPLYKTMPLSTEATIYSSI